MKLFLAAHILYFILIIVFTLKHAILPVLQTEKTSSHMLQIKERYNSFIQERELQNKTSPTEEEILMLKDLVIYSDLIGCRKVERLLSRPESASREIRSLHTKLKETINLPRKYPLKYSIECNLGMLCSLIIPALLASLMNIKGLIKKHMLVKQCFEKHVYEENVKEEKKNERRN